MRARPPIRLRAALLSCMHVDKRAHIHVHVRHTESRACLCKRNAGLGMLKGPYSFLSSGSHVSPTSNKWADCDLSRSSRRRHLASRQPACSHHPAVLSIWGPFRLAWPELGHRLSLVATCFGGSGTFHLSRELGPPGQVPLSACPITSHGSGHLAGLLVPPSRGVCSSDFLQTLHLTPGLPVSGCLPAPLAWSGWVHASEAGAYPRKLMAGPREGGWNVRLLTSGARSRLSHTQGFQRDLLRPQSSFTHGLNL